jgi:hypothetical protein
MLFATTVGGQGKSGVKPARSRHCDRVTKRLHDEVSHWDADGLPGRRSH